MSGPTGVACRLVHTPCGRGDAKARGWNFLWALKKKKKKRAGFYIRIPYIRIDKTADKLQVPYQGGKHI